MKRMQSGSCEEKDQQRKVIKAKAVKMMIKMKMMRREDDEDL